MCAFGDHPDGAESLPVSIRIGRNVRGPDQLRLTPDERADLVAFVDGELPESTSRSLSTKLTQSTTARREVEMLRKTWELLGHLPFPR